MYIKYAKKCSKCSFILTTAIAHSQPFVPEVLLTEQSQHQPQPSQSRQQQGPQVEDGVASGFVHFLLLTFTQLNWKLFAADFRTFQMRP